MAGLALIFLGLVAAALLANSVAADARARYALLLEEDRAGAAAAASQREKLDRIRRAAVPMREFATAWRPSAVLGEKEAAEGIRATIENVAQRQLGLVTDNAITPQPESYQFQGQTLRVQRVTLRASGKDLSALLAWLGRVEERYPAALIESCEFSSNVGGNTGLTLRLVQPVRDPGRRREPVRPSWKHAAELPAALAAVNWSDYLPQRLKRARAVGFRRNPLQPAVTGDVTLPPFARDDRDEVTPRLESALEGRVRSVIRGASPLVVIDGRIFRVGDELVLGPGRERLLPDAKTKLKQIGDRHLTLQVSGATIQCDVKLALPSFLSAR